MLIGGMCWLRRCIFLTWLVCTLPSLHTHSSKKKASPLLSWCVSMATLTSCCDRQSGPVAMVSRCDIKPEPQLPWHHTYWLSSYFCVMSGANRQRSYNVPFPFEMLIPLFCCCFMQLCTIPPLDLWRQVLYVHCKHLNDFLRYHSLSLVYHKKSFWWKYLFMSLMSLNKSWLSRTN